MAGRNANGLSSRNHPTDYLKATGVAGRGTSPSLKDSIPHSSVKNQYGRDFKVPWSILYCASCCKAGNRFVLPMEGQEMPVGDPKPQTIATKKYEKKAGFLSKSYKLKRDVVDQFAKACEEAGVSQASQLTKMMTTFACKKDVEREYVMQKQQLDNSVIQIQSAISALRKMQNEVVEESVQDEMGIIIDSLLDAKDKGLKAMKELYNIYNEAYQNTHE